MMQPTRRKIWLIIVPLMIFLLVVGIGIGTWAQSYSAKVIVESSPADSMITINGKKRDQGAIKVRPGVHKIAVSKQGFTTVSRSVAVAKDESKYVGIALVPSSPATANWYIDHPSDGKLLEGISSKNFDLSSADQIKKLPLIKNLPFIDQLYRIDYGRSQAHPNDPTALAIYIEYYSEQGKQQALEWLKFKGYGPDKLEIIYTNAEAQQ